jgi:hypothetical protein
MPGEAARLDGVLEQELGQPDRDGLVRVLPEQRREDIDEWIDVRARRGDDAEDQGGSGGWALSYPFPNRTRTV